MFLEVIADQFDGYRAEDQYGYQVGDGHESIESVSQIPRVGKGHRGADDREEYEHYLIGYAGLGSEEILEAAGSVEAPGKNRGQREERQAQSQDYGSYASAENGAEGRGYDGSAAAGSPGDLVSAGAVAAEHCQSGERADNDGIHEYLEYSEEALLYRVGLAGSSVSHRSGAETGLVGEAAAGYALGDGGRNGYSERSAQSSLSIEGALEDHAEYCADVADVGEDHDQSGYDVYAGHYGDDPLRYLTDTLDASEEHQRYDDCNKYSYDKVAERERIAREGDHRTLDVAAERIDRGADALAYGLDLGSVSDTERSQESEDAEQNTQPAEALAQTVLDVVHRAAYPVALVVALTVVDRQRNFRELGAHSYKRGDPHPEDCAGTAYYDSSGDAGDVAGTDRCSQSGGESLERCNFALAGLLLLEHLSYGVLHGVAELAELQELGAYAEDQAYAYQQTEHDGTPCDVVQLGYEFAECHDKKTPFPHIIVDIYVKKDTKIIGLNQAISENIIAIYQHLIVKFLFFRRNPIFPKFF